MRWDLKIRKISALSGAKTIQIVRYVDRKCVVIRHVGSAKTEIELEILMKEAECLREELCLQPSLFPAALNSFHLGGIKIPLELFRPIEYGSSRRDNHVEVRCAPISCYWIRGYGAVPRIQTKEQNIPYILNFFFGFCG